MAERPLNIGLLTTGPFASNALHDLSVWAGASPYARLACVVALPRAEAAECDGRGTDAGRGPTPGGGLAALTVIESRRLRGHPSCSGYLAHHDARSLAPRYIALRSRDLAERSADGSQLAELRSLGLDLLICLAPIECPELVIEAARLGILRVLQVDGPTAFWAVFDRSDTTGFAIEHRACGASSAAVLLHGFVPTRHYYLLNQAALVAKAVAHLGLLIERIAATGSIPVPQAEARHSLRRHGQPGVGAMSAYFLRSINAVLRKRLSSALGFGHRWQVSLLRAGWRDAASSRATAIANPPGHYFADPFVVTRDGRTCCFVEDYDESAQRGCISVCDVTADGTRLLGPVIEEPFHLSFPYLFDYDGQLFMCPESSEAREIRVYRCVSYPMEWQLHEVLMCGTRAADTMIFPHGGRWWLLTNIDPANLGDYCTELFAFHSALPLGGEWTPHSANPLIVDASRARNAGLLREGDRMFRVAQRQGFDQYGAGFAINEITSLTTDAYAERPVARFDASHRDGLVGTHHMHSNGRVTVFDELRLCRAGAFAVPVKSKSTPACPST